MRKRKLYLMFMLIFVLTGFKNVLHSTINKKFTEHLQLKIEGRVYRVGLMRTDTLRGEVVIARDGKIAANKEILRKVFHAGAIYGFFPDEEREYRFHNFLGRVNYFQSMYQEALNLIPVMEFLSFYAFNLGPRAVVEALEIAVTGGGSLVAKGGKALKVIGKKVVKEVARSTAKQALKDLAKNPRTYILTTLYSLLKGSISQFEWIKKKAEELKQRKVIDYDELVQLEELYWKARVEGWVALKMYENIKGDLISNLLDALKNSVEQLIGDVEYSRGIVTIVFLANQFKKVLDTTQVMRMVAGEMAKLKKEREDMERIRHQYWDKDMELVIKISEKFFSLAVLRNNSDGAMFRSNLRRTGFYTTKAVHKFTGVKWKYKTGGKIWSSPTVTNRVVYFGSNDGFLYALDTQTGREMWKFRAKEQIRSSPAIANGMVYFGSEDDHLYAVDTKTGRLNWKFKTFGYVFSSPAVTENIVYITCGNGYEGYIYALDAKTGGLKWKFYTSGIMSSPSIVNGIVYFGCDTGYLHALDAKTGQKRWTFKASNDIWSSPAIEDGIIYFGSRDHHLYAVDIKTQQMKWRYKTTGGVNSSPAVAGGVVYFGSDKWWGEDENYIYAIYAKSGKEKWKYRTVGNVGSSPSIAGGIVYFGSHGGYIYALDTETGNLMWKFKTSDSVSSSPTIDSGVVYIGGYDGFLYALW